jgi:hypothetical protein
VLLRLCATVQLWAIKLAYEIESSGRSRQPGGVVMSVFVFVAVFAGLGWRLCECKIIDSKYSV